MHDEIKYSILTGVSLLLTSAVLFIGSQGIHTRNEFASVRNGQIMTEIRMADYREFNKYSMNDCSSTCTEHIYGDELIELLRNYCGVAQVEIYVDTMGQGKGSLHLDMQSYWRDEEMFSYKELQKNINPKSEYHTYLVYNGNKASKVDSMQDPGLNSQVSGISVKWIKDN